MGRSRHRESVPKEVLGLTAALVLSGAVAAVLVGTATGAALRIGLVLCVVLAASAGGLALLVGRRAVASARAQVSRERAARSREAERLRRRVAAVEARARQLSTRLDAGEALIAGLRADLARSLRPAEVMRPTLVLPMVDQAVRAPAPVPSVRVNVPLDDPTAVAAALAPRDASITIDLQAEVELIEVIELVEVDVAEAAPQPEVAVIGEFSLIGLAAFPRPAGMPDPGLPTVGPAEAEADCTEVIDLRSQERDRTASGA